MTAQTKKVGDIELTALSDGRLATSLDVILGMDRAEAARLSGATGGDLHIAVNAFLLKLSGRWALIDAGAGNSMGPELGRLAENLRAFGVAPEPRCPGRGGTTLRRVGWAHRLWSKCRSRRSEWPDRSKQGWKHEYPRNRASDHRA